MNLLITGGAGFVGSHFVKYILKNRKDFKVTVIDALTYCGNLDNFTEDVWDNENFTFVKGNILDKELVFELVKKADIIVHFAAYTHVDRSIDLSDPFIDTDFKGTQVLLEAARHYPVKKFIHISTSEVYGSAQYVPMDENHPLCPQSPYAAAKAGGDRLCYSYYITYKLPVIIIRPFNIFGPNQYPEKMIPLFITNAIDNKTLPIYGTGENTRDWTYVEDTVRAIDRAIDVDAFGEVINIGTGKDYSVKFIAEKILEILGKPKELMEFVGDRPGHVKRLITSYKKAKEILGWEPEIDFLDGLKRTIKWYCENEWWWRKLKESPEFIEWEKRWYSKLRELKGCKS